MEVALGVLAVFNLLGALIGLVMLAQPGGGIAGAIIVGSGLTTAAILGGIAALINEAKRIRRVLESGRTEATAVPAAPRVPPRAPPAAARDVYYERPGDVASRTGQSVIGEPSVNPRAHIPAAQFGERNHPPEWRGEWGEHRVVHNVEVTLDYRDAHGDLYENRRVDIRHIFIVSTGDAGFQAVAVNGFCHRRHDYRTFMVERILKMTLPSTGAVIGDPAAWLAHQT